MEGCYVYILKCGDGGYYTGLTKNPFKRMKQHHNGQSKSTRNRLPVYQVFQVYLQNRKEARKLEKQIKGRGAKRFLQKHRHLRFEE